MANAISLACPNASPIWTLEVISPLKRGVIKFLTNYSFEETWPRKLSLSNLITKELRAPIDIIVAPDDDNYLARCPDLPLYGHGASVDEAVEMLKREIESMYDDLSEDDSFTEDWKAVKRFLEERIIRSRDV